MNVLIEAAREVSAFMAEHQWGHCIIGGLALQTWGRPRTTLDVDMTLLTGWGNEASYVDAMLERFPSRLSDARDFALERRILLLRAGNGKDVDVALGALPFEEDMVGRAVLRVFGEGIMLPCCTAEDLFVMKVFAGRPRDWEDAESIVMRQTDLDRGYILSHLEELCALKETPDSLARGRRLLGEKP